MRSLSPILMFSLLAAGTAVLVTGCASKDQPLAAAEPQPLSGSSVPKEFKAYFASGKAILSSDERRSVDSAAAELRANPSATVRLVGKTDSAGGEARNMTLSHQRTDAVYNALIGAGIAPNRIDRQSVGESQLEVPTANGVREPRNRVVDIYVGI